ncbi:hypothetical protein [Luteibacter aegosomatissinici]|uniref:hypothetical protein n=1 Tax=Luteibacter aegosomatissinici TaxID=2911539 RepID=UPI001FF9D31B|nr:hypothetical protein [Luteibacter aegosomatissinici]UPG95423.1 hypothetical protein L2Y97_04740 [Luteibacter aegosomatissinici]
MRHALLMLVSAFAVTPALAGGGTIAFTGDIREPTCPMDDAQPACTRAARFEVQKAAPRDLPQVRLLAYVLARAPGVRWHAMNIVYR